MNAVAYARYSTDNQTENSIEYQLSAIHSFCERSGYDLIDVYSDEAKSGTNTNRDGLQRLLAACKTKAFHAVIIYDQSRLSRRVVDWFTLRETLHGLGIKLISCTQSLNDNALDSTGFLTEGVQAIFNQVHVLETRKKTIAGVTNKAKRAEFCGGSPPLGYDVVNGVYVINEQEAPAIRMIFELYSKGFSYKHIVEELRSQGYRSKFGKEIGTNAIYYLLTNERYTGVFTWNKHQYKQMNKRIGKRDNENYVRVESALPALIDMDTWRKVQKRMEQNQRGTNKAKREYLLSGLVECGYCGGTYTAFASRSKGSGQETIYYMCGKRNRLGAKSCKGKNVRADQIEPFAYYSLKDAILNEKVIELVADKLIEAKANENPNSIEGVKKALAKCQRNIDKVMDDLMATERGRPSYNMILDKLDALSLEKQDLERQLVNCPPSNNIDRNELIVNLRRDLQQLEQGDFHIRRAIIREYIEKIVITNNTVELRFVGDYDNIGGATPFYEISQIIIPRVDLIKYAQLQMK